MPFSVPKDVRIVTREPTQGHNFFRITELRRIHRATACHGFCFIGDVPGATTSAASLTYTYNLDGSVASVAYTNAQISTPGVTWTYDPAYPRVTTMVDGTGTTTYTYHAAGQLGVGQVPTVDGPLTNDVISYTYDQLGGW